jgi:hypothetical protein
MDGLLIMQQERTLTVEHPINYKIWFSRFTLI